MILTGNEIQTRNLLLSDYSCLLSDLLSFCLTFSLMPNIASSAKWRGSGVSASSTKFLFMIIILLHYSVIHRFCCEFFFFFCCCCFSAVLFNDNFLYAENCFAYVRVLVHSSIDTRWRFTVDHPFCRKIANLCYRQTSVSSIVFVVRQMMTPAIRRRQLAVG